MELLTFCTDGEEFFFSNHENNLGLILLSELEKLKPNHFMFGVSLHIFQAISMWGWTSLSETLLY